MATYRVHNDSAKPDWYRDAEVAKAVGLGGEVKKNSDGSYEVTVPDSSQGSWQSAAKLRGLFGHSNVRPVDE